MKSAWAGGICAGLVVCFAAGPASTADMAVPATTFTPAYNWSGFFVGGHLGYGWGGDSMTLTTSSYPLGTIPPAIAADPRGFVGGVQYGTNWQIDRFVLGTDSDFSFTDIRHSQTIITTGSITNTGEQKLPWFGTTRVRAGYAIQDNLMIYATGGLANGRAEAVFPQTAPRSGPQDPVPRRCGAGLQALAWNTASDPGLPRSNTCITTSAA